MSSFIPSNISLHYSITIYLYTYNIDNIYRNYIDR